jgi:hypothetical protein
MSAGLPSYREKQRIIAEEQLRIAVQRSSRERHDRTGFLSTLNKPFTLWFLSSVAIGLGGAFYTEYKDCRSMIEKTSERENRLTIEIRNRSIPLFAAALDLPAKNGTRDDQLDQFLSSQARYTFVEFQNRNIFDLVYELQKIYQQYFMIGSLHIYKRFPRFLWDRVEVEKAYFIPELPPILGSRDSSQFENLVGISQHRKFLEEQGADGSAKAMARMQREQVAFSSKLMLSRVAFEKFIDTKAAFLKPRRSCSIPDLTRHLIGIPDKATVEALPLDLLYANKTEPLQFNMSDIVRDDDVHRGMTHVRIEHEFLTYAGRIEGLQTWDGTTKK